MFQLRMIYSDWQQEMLIVLFFAHLWLRLQLTLRRALLVQHLHSEIPEPLLNTEISRLWSRQRMLIQLNSEITRDLPKIGYQDQIIKSITSMFLVSFTRTDLFICRLYWPHTRNNSWKHVFKIIRQNYSCSFAWQISKGSWFA